ncbi:MAG TPA: nuclear transport factor 2 family protein [Solirubrobacteraceae bacterium]|nr:nuclear transport factor 2 family protein [Solirubrobacteraceae bacterium]
MPRRLAVLVLAAFAVAGCGTTSSAGDFSGAEQGVAEQVEALQSAGESRDGEEACSRILSRALREAMAAQGSGCANQVEEAMRDADDVELDVRDVTVQGDRATARVRARFGGADRVRTLQLVREDGGWRIDSLG